MIDRMRQLARRVRALIQRDDRERGMDEEMQFHVEMEAADLVRKGHAPEDAKRRARVAFGGVERHKEDGRDARGTRLVEDVAQDLRYAVRQLRASPGYTAATLVTLALGIGLTTAMFSIVNVSLLATLPFDRPDRLVFVRQYSPRNCPTCDFTAAGNYLTIRDQSKTLETVSMSAEWSPVVRGAERSDVLRGSRVTSEFFNTLRVRPLLGRMIAPADSAIGRDHVVVLNETLWRTRFAADSAVVGRALVIDGAVFQIIGVVSATDAYPASTELWVPLALGGAERGERRWTNYKVIGRLRDGVTYAAGGAELAALGWAVARAFPAEMNGYTFGLIPLVERERASDGDQLYLFVAAVGLVLLIACTNLASLLIARLSARDREIAVRAAMGAGATRIARQLLTETILLSVSGGVLGLLIAAGAIRIIRQASPPGMLGNMPGWSHLGLDVRALGFALAAGALTGFAIGVWPALRFSRVDVLAGLKEAARGATSNTGARVRHWLVVAQIALAVVLLSAAGLLARSVQNLYGAPRGFTRDHVLAVRVQLPSAAGAKADPELFDGLVAELKAVPGVESAAATIALPLSFAYSGNTFQIEGRSLASGSSRTSSRMQPVTSDYFALLRIPIIRGRAFTDADRATAPRVAIVNEAFVRQFMPGEDPIGHALLIDGKRWEIVGLNRNLYYMRSNQTAEPEVYRPMRQWPTRWGHIALRTRGDPMQLAPAVSRALRRIEPDMGISRILTMDGLLADALAPQRLMLGIMGGFALASLLISVIGLYAVISYAVTQRSREFGIRLALGARSASILRMVLARGLSVAALGGVSGLVAAWAVTRLMRGLLFGVTATDPATLGGVVVGIAALAVAASYLPARRAARVDPMTSLRND